MAEALTTYRIIIGISGASGAPIAIELLRQLKNMPEVETYLVYTYGAELTIAQETDMDMEQVKTLADHVYDIHEVGAPPASGSFKMDAMVVVPCSMKTLAGIVSGYSDNLLLRAADVTIKERRPLILVPRECPLSPIHLRNLRELSQMGTVIIPPVLSYYNHPKTIEDCTRHIVGKIMDQLGLKTQMYKRWNGMDDENDSQRMKSEISEKNKFEKESCSHIRKLNLTKIVRNHPIHMKVAVLDEGVNVLIAGGEHTHIGAVTMISPEGEPQSIQYPGHKDSVLADEAAKKLYEKFHCPVTVSAGVHYDDITKEEITEVVQCVRKMLEQVISQLKTS